MAEASARRRLSANRPKCLMRTRPDRHSALTLSRASSCSRPFPSQRRGCQLPKLRHRTEPHATLSVSNRNRNTLLLQFEDNGGLDMSGQARCKSSTSRARASPQGGLQQRRSTSGLLVPGYAPSQRDWASLSLLKISTMHVGPHLPVRASHHRRHSDTAAEHAAATDTKGVGPACSCGVKKVDAVTKNGVKTATL